MLCAVYEDDDVWVWSIQGVRIINWFLCVFRECISDCWKQGSTSAPHTFVPHWSNACHRIEKKDKYINEPFSMTPSLWLVSRGIFTTDYESICAARKGDILLRQESCGIPGGKNKEVYFIWAARNSCLPPFCESFYPWRTWHQIIIVLLLLLLLSSCWQ